MQHHVLSHVKAVGLTINKMTGSKTKKKKKKDKNNDNEKKTFSIPKTF